jgi:hypothetical protein
MKNKNILRYVVVFSLMVLTFACKTKKNEQVFVIPNYIKVSFISIGSGTDGVTRKQFLEYLETYQAEQKITLEINSRNWGREGEKDYCISTSALNKDKYTILNEWLLKMMENKELVRLAYLDVCAN